MVTVVSCRVYRTGW